MKKFVQSLSQVFVNLCVAFTIAVLIFAAFSRGALPQGMVWQLLLLSAAATLLQFVFFSGKAVKRLSYLWRMALFAALMLGWSAPAPWGSGGSPWKTPPTGCFLWGCSWRCSPPFLWRSRWASACGAKCMTTLWAGTKRMGKTEGKGRGLAGRQGPALIFPLGA